MKYQAVRPWHVVCTKHIYVGAGTEYLPNDVWDRFFTEGEAVATAEWLNTDSWAENAYVVLFAGEKK